MPTINPIWNWRISRWPRPCSATSAGRIPRMLAEMRRLQQQIRDLESELVRLQEENDVLTAEVGNDMLVSVREQART